MKFSMPNVTSAINRVKSEVRSQLSSVQPEINKIPSLVSDTRAQLETEAVTRKEEFTTLGQNTLSGTAGGGD